MLLDDFIITAYCLIERNVKKFSRLKNSDKEDLNRIYPTVKS